MGLPKKKKKPRQDEDERAEDDQDAQKKPKKKGGGLGLWLALGGVVAGLFLCLAVGGGVGSYFYFFASVGRNHPDTPEGLKEQITELMDAIQAKNNARADGLAREFAIPDHRAWLTQTFGEEHADKAIAEYEQAVLGVEIKTGLVDAIKRRVKQNQTKITVFPVEGRDRVGTTVTQSRMLAKMKVPRQLYTVRFRMPDNEVIGGSLDSFVYVDGKFRLLGQLRNIAK